MTSSAPPPGISSVRTHTQTLSQREVLANCQALSKSLQTKGYNIVSGGTDNHLILVNVRDKGLDGSKVCTARVRVGQMRAPEKCPVCLF